MHSVNINAFYCEGCSHLELWSVHIQSKRQSIICWRHGVAFGHAGPLALLITFGRSRSSACRTTGDPPDVTARAPAVTLRLLFQVMMCNANPCNVVFAPWTCAYRSPARSLRCPDGFGNTCLVLLSSDIWGVREAVNGTFFYCSFLIVVPNFDCRDILPRCQKDWRLHSQTARPPAAGFTCSRIPGRLRICFRPWWRSSLVTKAQVTCFLMQDLPRYRS